MEEKVGVRSAEEAGSRAYEEQALQHERYDDTKSDELLGLPYPLRRPLPAIVRRVRYCPAAKQRYGGRDDKQPCPDNPPQPGIGLESCDNSARSQESKHEGNKNKYRVISNTERQIARVVALTNHRLDVNNRACEVDA